MTDTPQTNSARVDQLRQMLHQTHAALAQRDRQLLEAMQIPPGAPPSPPPALPLGLRQIADQCLPTGAAVLVINKGDDDLLMLGDRFGWPFPQTESGEYSWSYPADSGEAIAHLQQLMQKGRRVDAVIIPAPAFWWAEHYPEFYHHLETDGKLVWRDEACVIFDLKGGAAQHLPAVMPIARLRPRLPWGVNIAGNFNAEKGTGEAVRSNVRSLAAAKVPFSLNYVPDESSSNTAETINHPFSADNPYAVNLIHLNPDSVESFLNTWGEQYLHGRYNIGYWVWELADFPRKWARQFGCFDEIWVPTDFVLDSISRCSPVPVVKIPHSLLPRRVPVEHADLRFNPQPGVFRFLFMFDFHSFMERKNPFGLIEAFKLAFGDRTDVQLLLKCSRSTPDDLLRLKQAIGGSNIDVFEAVLTREELTSLIASCDSYVSLHRSEGFGLTMAEAMGLGKPVIATGYSGNLEFMSAGNSHLVDYELVKLGVDHGDYHGSSEWADANLDHAAALMQQVVENPQAARLLGSRGRADIENKFSPAAVGRLIHRRLEVIKGLADWIAGPADPVAAIARAVIPPHSRVAVACGGDERLLQLPAGQRAIHFPQRHDGQPDLRSFSLSQLLAHLEIVRRQGARYFLLPQRRLNAGSLSASVIAGCFPNIHSDAVCDIFDLTAGPGVGGITETAVNTEPHHTYHVTAGNGRWIVPGADCYLVFALPEPVFVSAIRIQCSFAAVHPDRHHAALMRLFWHQAEVNEFSEQRHALFRQDLNRPIQDQLIIINDTIDRIRFDPDIAPAEVENLMITVLLPAAGPAEAR